MVVVKDLVSRLHSPFNSIRRGGSCCISIYSGHEHHHHQQQQHNPRPQYRGWNQGQKFQIVSSSATKSFSSSSSSSDNPVQVNHTTTTNIDSLSTTTSQSTTATATTPQSNPSRRQRQMNNVGGGGGGESSSSSSGRTRTTKKQFLATRNVPSYKEFVHRFTVVTMYRGYLRAISKCMPHNKMDLIQQVQKEFRANRNDTDPFNIQRSLAEGKRRYAELQEMIGMDNVHNEGNSWLNIQDEDDPRGRVGNGWPWQK